MPLCWRLENLVHERGLFDLWNAALLCTKKLRIWIILCTVECRPECHETAAWSDWCPVQPVCSSLCGLVVVSTEIAYGKSAVRLTVHICDCNTKCQCLRWSTWWKVQQWKQISSCQMHLVSLTIMVACWHEASKTVCWDRQLKSLLSWLDQYKNE